MKPIMYLKVIVWLWVVSTLTWVIGQDVTPPIKEVAFTFKDVEYFHRFTQADQHEYTPAGQEDLSTWRDMMTINLHRQTTDGEGLAEVANRVIANYQALGGTMLKTRSEPRTATKPAEHLAICVFHRERFSEIAFARFQLRDGVGHVMVYCHREYGQNAKETLERWAKDHGESMEVALMKWDSLPKIEK